MKSTFRLANSLARIVIIAIAQIKLVFQKAWERRKLESEGAKQNNFLVDTISVLTGYKWKSGQSFSEVVFSQKD